MGFIDRYFGGGRKEDPGAESAGSEPEEPDSADFVRAYHRATKHHVGRYARGPQGLDWATQPDPFRRFAGAEVIELAHPDASASPAYDDIAAEGRVPSAPVCLDSISSLLRFALGLSAWKAYAESRWALRINPSSGNLHPTEGYLVSGPVEGLCESGLVAHYAPAAHALEVRARFDATTWHELAGGLPGDALIVGLSSILWREEWKYGERAYRYCQHDVGHAIAALAYSASCLGWRVRMLDHLSSGQVATILGLQSSTEAEAEEGDCLLAIFPDAQVTEPLRISDSVIESFTNLDWKGTPNVLSSDHLEWEAVQACALAALKPVTDPHPISARDEAEIPRSGDSAALEIIANRRSAVALDSRTGMGREVFYSLLEKCMPRGQRVPFSAMPWRPRIHFALFVHRVEGLEPGAYVLLRDSAGGERLKACLADEFDWTRPEGCPASLPLFHLKSGNLVHMAASVSCDQAIAGAGAFSLGMLAEFDDSLKEYGGWFYPRLFWESGLVGQTLYLEAEAAGLRGTGIGCFFDDSVHGVLGMASSSFQSLYHFTIGGPVEDTRIQSQPPY